MEQIIKLAEFYYILGYDIREAITMAININRQIEIDKYGG